MDTDASPIVVEQVFQAPLESVWQALVQPDRMRQWFFAELTDFVPEPGLETRFNVRAEGRDFLHHWQVTEVVPERKIAYRWRYEGYPGDSVVTWELAVTSGGTRLRFTHQGSETFPGEDPMFSREACQGGWDHFIRGNLKAHLEGSTR